LPILQAFASIKFKIMERIKLNLPENFNFSTIIPIRISDVNYGGHVGNDSFLSLLHEARLRFLHQFGYSEMSVEGVGLIMSDVGIEY
jgi:acyl-CoA thioesterase FadM